MWTGAGINDYYASKDNLRVYCVFLAVFAVGLSVIAARSQAAPTIYCSQRRSRLSFQTKSYCIINSMGLGGGGGGGSF